MKKRHDWQKTGNFIAACGANFLLVMFWHGRDVPIFIQLFIYALVISIWEWLFRPLFVELGEFLNKKRHNSSEDKK